mmetsp:Transcript_8217/g.19678  ORF Transcript_8217/g.19678 Transcript_8217/m.19678 type:complete len:315 (+) Transcript_8217:1583-2527(+)
MLRIPWALLRPPVRRVTQLQVRQGRRPPRRRGEGGLDGGGRSGGRGLVRPRRRGLPLPVSRRPGQARDAAILGVRPLLLILTRVAEGDRQVGPRAHPLMLPLHRVDVCSVHQRHLLLHPVSFGMPDTQHGPLPRLQADRSGQCRPPGNGRFQLASRHNPHKLRRGMPTSRHLRPALEQLAGLRRQLAHIHVPLVRTPPSEQAADPHSSIPAVLAARRQTPLIPDWWLQGVDLTGVYQSLHFGLECTGIVLKELGNRHSSHAHPVGLQRRVDDHRPHRCAREDQVIVVEVVGGDPGQGREARRAHDRLEVRVCSG